MIELSFLFSTGAIRGASADPRTLTQWFFFKSKYKIAPPVQFPKGRSALFELKKMFCVFRTTSMCMMLGSSCVFTDAPFC